MNRELLGNGLDGLELKHRDHLKFGLPPSPRDLALSQCSGTSLSETESLSGYGRGVAEALAFLSS